MSYESPITMIYREMQTQIEDGMLKAVQDVGFNVNKIELQKALMYDRKQYSQGFEDGKKFAEEERCGRIKLRDFVTTMRMNQSMEIRNEYNYTQFKCSKTALVLDQFMECEVIDWFVPSVPSTDVVVSIKMNEVTEWTK